MNSDVQPEAQGEESPAGGLSFGDILFTIFRHKFLILCSIVLGIMAAAAVRFVKPPNFESTAQIYLPFVVEIPVVNPNDPNTGIRPTGGGGQMQMLTEVDLLKSFNTALEVADKIGAEKILARYGGGSNRLGAAGVVASGIWVNPPQTMSLTLTFSHRDPELVQPVLQAIVDVYMRFHKNLHLGNIDEFVKNRDAAGAKLATIEEQIKELKTEAGVPDLQQRQEAVATSSAELQAQIFQSQSELDRRRADIGEINQSMTNLQASPIPSETIVSYSEVIEQIEEFKRRRRTMLQVDDLTPNHPSVAKVDVKIQDQLRQKLELEKQYPTLTNYISALPRSGGTTNGVPRFDLEAELANIKRLDRTLEADKARLESLTQEAFRLMGLERKLLELERQRDAVKKDYEYNANSVDRVKRDDGGAGKVVNMKITQSPTPPSLNKKKLLKLLGAAFGGCVGLGLGIAFLYDMVLDRSIRRPAQIVRGLKLPVVLTIPDMNRKESSLLPWTRRNRNLKVMRPDKKQKAAEAANAVAPWSPDNQLQSHIEGLRERVITHFEVKNLDHHPKLVAVTACTHGAGVSILASGLAASLSRTGSGSVLLVDLNAGEGVTHSFYKGKPGYGPSESIETDAETDQEDTPVRGKNLSLTKLPSGQSKPDRLAGMLPLGFNDHMPKLKADAYDYIVFDMTCISPASVTPRMSGHMDLVLFVVESEKTKEHTARHARGLMRESRANVVAILNKYYNPVPEWLSHD
jgi:succinoglycan biosynthesis transport protein ExoP